MITLYYFYYCYYYYDYHVYYYYYYHYYYCYHRGFVRNRAAAFTAGHFYIC